MQNDQSPLTNPTPNPALAGAAPDPNSGLAFAQPAAGASANPAGARGAAPRVTSSPSPEPPRRKSPVSIIETIFLVIMSIVAIVFIYLFVQKYIEWDSIKTDIDGQIDAAVAVAISENTSKMEEEFAEREKYPYKTFSGPADYGSLNFEYPKTWSVYISKDATSGGNFEAYLNPSEVLPISNTTINALRVFVLDQTFENVVRSYDNLVSRGQLTISTRNIGNTVANIYSGDLSRNIRGIATIFKVRDKTVVLQTDAELFAAEYYKIIDTVTFVE